MLDMLIGEGTNQGDHRAVLGSSAIPNKNRTNRLKRNTSADAGRIGMGITIRRIDEGREVTHHAGVAPDEQQQRFGAVIARLFCNLAHLRLIRSARLRRSARVIMLLSQRVGLVLRNVSLATT